MSFLLKVANLIRINVLIAYYCKKYNIDKNEAKKIASNKLVTRNKKQAANKIIKLGVKRKITMITIAMSAVTLLLVAFIYNGMVLTTEQQMQAVASYNITGQSNSIGGEYIVFSGEAICDLYGEGGLHIDASAFSEYGVRCNGEYAIKVVYRSYESYNIDKEEDRCTIIANTADQSEQYSVVEDTQSEELIEIPRVISSGYKSNIALFANALSSEKLDLTTSTKEYEIVLHSGDEKILESGSYITGYNWIITEAYIVDIEKRREWQLNNGYDESLIAGSGTNGSTSIDRTLNPQQRSLKNWYQYISDIEKACEQVGVSYCKPYQLIGTFFREVNGSISADMNSNTWAYEVDLTGTATNADKASGVIVDEANNGYGQWNKGKWESSRMRNGSMTRGEALTQDSSLGIYRPNCWYAPDQVWTSYVYNAQEVLASNTWSQIESNSSFQSLSDEDKSFILGFVVEAYHNRGSGKFREEVDSAIALCNIAVNKASYGMSSLYDMADAAGVVTWVESSRTYSGAGIDLSVIAPDKNKYDSTFGLNWRSSSEDYYYQEYSYLNALCGGYKCYKQMMSLIVADSPVITPSGGTSVSGNTVVAAAQHVWDTWQAEGCTYYSQAEWYTTSTYGKIRPDCSGYVSCVLWELGYTTSYNPLYSGRFFKNDIGWQVVGYGEATEIQPGDILAYTGHVQIFAGYGPSGERLWFSWGNNTAASNPGPGTSADTHFTSGRNFVILRAPN